MRELRDISSAFAALRQIRGLAVLASVVHVEGSTYRRPGARALVLSDDRVVGLVSGGCLEGDLVARARAVRETGEALRLRYDSRGDDDLVFGLGLGCRGVVDVLLERPDRSTSWRAACAGARSARSRR
jgi:xanthine dehydrogenase accessory factor